MSSTIRIAGIIKSDLANGPGIRTTVFFQGCKHHCPGCQNAQTWDPDGGVERTVDRVIAEILDDKLSAGLSISGGEPLDQLDGLMELIGKARRLKKIKDIWLWTGYEPEHITDAQYLAITPCTVVYGPFIKACKREGLAYRGSSNQRIMVYDPHKTYQNHIGDDVSSYYDQLLSR